MTDNRDLRRELAVLLGINPATADIADKMKLDRVVTLRLYIAKQLALQESGHELDVAELERASRMLDTLLPTQPQIAADLELQGYDLAQLNLAELSTLYPLLARMKGQPVDASLLPPDLSTKLRDAERELANTKYELNFLQRGPAVETISELRARIAELEAQIEELQKPDPTEEEAQQWVREQFAKRGLELP